MFLFVSLFDRISRRLWGLLYTEGPVSFDPVVICAELCQSPACDAGPSGKSNNHEKNNCNALAKTKSLNVFSKNGMIMGSESETVLKLNVSDGMK